MAVRTFHIIDTTLDTANEAVSGTFDFQGVTPTRVSLYVQSVESGSGATWTLTVEFSPDKGQTLIAYDKLLTHDGTDAPQASEVYTSTEDDVISISPEDVLDYIKVTATDSGSGTGSNKHAVDVWLVWTF